MSGWTDARVEVLKTLWLDGFSASQVARALGGVTRNAVIGKVHRLGLSGRGAPAASQLGVRRPPRPPPAATPRRRVVAKTPLPLPPPPPAAAPVLVCEEGPGAVAGVEALGRCMCKWPLGDPRSDTFTFCGKTTEGGPYCRNHTRVGAHPGAAKAAQSDRRLIGYLRRIGAVAA